MTSVAVIAVAIAISAFFTWHIVDRVTDAEKRKADADEISKLKKEIYESLKVGDIARAGQLRQRVRALQGK